MPIICFHISGKFCIMSKLVVCSASQDLWQRLVKMFKVWNFYIWEPLKDKTQILIEEIDSLGFWGQLTSWWVQMSTYKLDLVLRVTKITCSCIYDDRHLLFRQFLPTAKKIKSKNPHCQHFPAHSCFLPILITEKQTPISGLTIECKWK
jgi:hypothetical protein